MNSINPVNDSVSIDDPFLLKLISQINKNSSPITLPVIDNPLPCGNCYWNVDAIVQKNGGSMVLGWDVNQWSGSHLSAVHHAVYLSPDGKYYDVTEKQAGTADMKKTVFIPDNKISITVDRLPCIGMHFLIIKNSIAVKKYIDAYRNLNDIEKENSRTLYAYGYRCEPNKDIARGLPPRESVFSESEGRKVQKLASDIHQARVILGRAITNLKLLTNSNK